MDALLRFRKRMSSEEGLALPMVMAASVVVFLLVMTMIALVEQQALDTARQDKRTRAMHLADAGVNAYLYELRRNPNYWASNPELGPMSMRDGAWQVAATPPSADEPLTLRSVGTIAGEEASRTVLATVRFPTFADYMFLADSDINIGADATIEGKLRSNRNVNNAGHVTGRVYAAGTVTGGGQFDDGYEAGVARVDFAQVTADIADLRDQAQRSGSDYYYPDSGLLYQGYYVTLVNSSLQISYVVSGASTGVLVTLPIRTVSVPADGVVFFDDDVWVSGTYSAKLTIGTSQNIYIPNNVQPANMQSSATLGLIAQKSVIVPSWYPNMPQNMTVTAAMLAQSGSIYGDLHSGVTKNSIVITGSMAYKTYGYFAQYSYGTVTAGFRTRTYRYDPRLDIEPPPMYPQIRDGTLKVSTWVEQ